MSMKTLKDVATVVGAVAGIVTGVDKVKNTIARWKYEYKERKQVSDNVKKLESYKDVE